MAGYEEPGPAGPARADGRWRHVSSPCTRTFAIELAGSAGRFTYSADCAPNEQLVQFACDTDLLLIEATLPGPERTGKRGHLTSAEAGEHARRAGARRLVLTHFSDELDPDWARLEAGEAYGGPVELAYEGAVYAVPAPG